MRDKLACQSIEQLRMARRMTFPVMGRLDDAGPHQSPPDPVHDDVRKARVLRRGDERGQAFARILGRLHQLVDRLVVGTAGHFGERPRGWNDFARFERDLISDSRVCFSKNAAGTVLVLGTVTGLRSSIAASEYRSFCLVV